MKDGGDDKMKLFQKMMLIITVLCLSDCSVLSALETSTHKIINKFIATKELNGFRLDQYLKKHLGFFKGTEEEFRPKDSGLKPEKEEEEEEAGYQVWRWISSGGKWEDLPPEVVKIPYRRSFNHFLNPINNEGYSNTGFYLFPLSFVFIRGPWDSAPDWFQKPAGGQHTGGHYSWNDVRGYFYEALTSPDTALRDDNFVNMFRGLGQIMHLVEDMSVPVHTRNDAHIFFNYEKWVEKKNESSLLSPDSLSSYHFFEGSAIERIADLFDTDQYNGTNPEVIAPGRGIGLAEYTNANFFSEDTIYSTSKFPYPYRRGKITVSSIPDWRDPSGTAFREYHMWNDGYEQEDYRLAVTSFVRKYWTKAGSEEHEDELPAVLDGEVYADYSKRLIPRAVGYASQVLSYFFRGKIEISLPETGVYGVIPDPDSVTDPPVQGFGSIRLRARNVTGGTEHPEEMRDGKLTLVIKYRISQGDPFRPPVPPTSEEFYYIVKEAGDNCTVPRESPAGFVFDLGGTPLPLWATDVSFYLVFRGKLGEEEDAVAAGFKDVCEPTPADVFNVMDRICLFSEVCTADGSGPEEAGDTYPHDMKISFGFLPDGPPRIIRAGEYLRQFVLSDRQFAVSLSGRDMPVSPADSYGHYSSSYSLTLSGIVNQYYGGVRTVPGFSKFRCVYRRTASALIYALEGYPASDCRTSDYDYICE